MKQFLFLLTVLVLSACGSTVVNIEVQHYVKTPDGYTSETKQHEVAKNAHEFSRPRWGYPGARLDSVSRMLSGYMNTSVWCFEDYVQGVRVAKCTTKGHLDTVLPSENTYFRYVYAPDARNAGIAIPVFIDDCYLCRWRHLVNVKKPDNARAFFDGILYTYGNDDLYRYLRT